MDDRHRNRRTVPRKCPGSERRHQSRPQVGRAERLRGVPLKQLAPLLYRIFGIEAKDCYRFYIDIKRRKNESRTYFLDRMQEKLNRKILRDEELERMRR